MIPLASVLEIELTTRCALRCPSCPRTKHRDQARVWNDGDIDPDDLITAVKSIAEHIRYVAMIGAYGDCIYHPQILHILGRLKSEVPNLPIHVETNGSHRDPGFWQAVGTVLDAGDVVTFSIDGDPDNFTNYRINASWQSIEEALRILGTYPVETVWKYVLFRYNTTLTSLANAYRAASELCVDTFRIVVTGRAPDTELVETYPALELVSSFLADLPEEPSGPKVEVAGSPKGYLTGLALPPRVSQAFVARTAPRGQTPKEVARPDCSAPSHASGLVPKCVRGRDEWSNFLGADGLLYPCCYARADKIGLAEAGIDLASMDIRGTRADGMPGSRAWQEIASRFESDPLRMCRRFCGPS